MMDQLWLDLVAVVLVVCCFVITATAPVLSSPSTPMLIANASSFETCCRLM